MFGVSSLGTHVNDFLGVFGVRGAGIGLGIDALTGNSAGVLANMHDRFLETAYGRGTGPLERRFAQFGAFPPMGYMPSPAAMMPTMAPLCGCGYAGGFGGGFQSIDLAPGTTNVPFLSQLFSPQRRAAGRFERMLRNNPAARAAFEQSIGGRIVDFGIRNDGKMTVQRFSPGFMPPPGAGLLNPLVGPAMGWLGGISSGAFGAFGAAGALMNGVSNLTFGTLGALTGGIFGMSPFTGFAGAGFGNVLGMMGPAGFGAGPFDNSGPLGGQAFGSWNPNAMPGRINNTNPAYESAHQAEVAGVLSDPSLTMEDKVTLMIMLIMKKMDKDIERQSQYINSIQQQQSSRGGGGGKGGKGGKGGFMGIGGKGKGAGAGGGGNSSPSIDVETMKLKRMVDKRGQMFDMLRQIIDRYNETAKGIIQSMGR